MKKIKVFLGAYINSTNAQNLNCFALAKHLDKKKFDVYTLELYSGNLQHKPINGVSIFRCFYPHKVSQYIGYLWGIWKSDVAYLPKNELRSWNNFLLKILRKKSFTTVEGILDDFTMKSLIQIYGNKEKALSGYGIYDKVYSITNFMRTYNGEYHHIKSERTILYLGTDIDTFLNTSKEIQMLTNVLLLGNDLLRKGV